MACVIPFFEHIGTVLNTITLKIWSTSDYWWWTLWKLS